MSTPIKELWYLDSNYRVYEKRTDKNSNPSSGPINYHHWVRAEIVSENSKSWIGKYKKFPKANQSMYLFSEEDVTARATIEDNIYKLVEYVRVVKDYETFKRVANLVGYEIKPCRKQEI